MTKTARPLIVAHRGASFDAPENTLPAFRVAWEQGADGIELDVRLSADGRIVCIHDEDMKRVTGGRSPLVVKDSRLSELQALDVGLWKGKGWLGKTVPLLEEALAIIPPGKLAFVELKTGPEIVAPLSKVLLDDSVLAEQIVIISFDESVVSACRKHLPDYRRHLLVDYRQLQDGAWMPDVDEVIARVQRTGADGLGTQNLPQHVDEAFVARMRTANLREFHVWTVDDPETARFYERLGAWAVTTNRPAELLSVFAT